MTGEAKLTMVLITMGFIQLIRQFGINRQQIGLMHLLENHFKRLDVMDTVKDSECYNVGERDFRPNNSDFSWRKVRKIINKERMLRRRRNRKRRERRQRSHHQSTIDTMPDQQFAMFVSRVEAKMIKDRRKKLSTKIHGEIALMAQNRKKGFDNLHFGRDTWIADSGASTHLGNSEEGMFDVEEIKEPVTIGDGTKLYATKIGKKRCTVLQANGDTMDIVLDDYKFVPKLQHNLFSITKALDNGWSISNKGLTMKLKKGDWSLSFDRRYKTDTGRICGVDILPRIGAEGERTKRGTDTAYVTGIRTWDINKMHKVYNHASEEVLRATAKERGWVITGRFETCKDCPLANAKQKGVKKTTETESTEPCERLFLDITSIQEESLGGGKFWVVIVDDATSITFSFITAAKSHLPSKVKPLLKELNCKRDTTLSSSDVIMQKKTRL